MGMFGKAALVAVGLCALFSSTALAGEKVVIKDVTGRDVEVSVRPWPAENGDGVMGMGMLKGSDFLLDVKAGKLWIIPRLPSKPGQ